MIQRAEEWAPTSNPTPPLDWIVRAAPLRLMLAFSVTPLLAVPFRFNCVGLNVALLALQARYVDWHDALPEGLLDTPTGEALQAIAELDLAELGAIEPPRGFGRD